MSLMKKENAEALVKHLMEKLRIQSLNLDDIMCYSTSKSLMAPMLLAIKRSPIIGSPPKEEKDTDDDMPECACKVYFQWEDVIGSIMEHPDKVHYLEQTCPDCGGKMLQIDFWSPYFMWHAHCGRSGPMVLCPECPRQIAFSLTIMN